MGTRSITKVVEDGQEICRIYRQYDGYPEGHGLDLAKLCNVKLTNGISGDGAGTANGMGCLAAQIILGLKQQVERPNHVGAIYLVAPTGDDEESYNYVVSGEVGGKPRIECIGVFTGTSDEWLAKNWDEVTAD